MIVSSIANIQVEEPNNHIMDPISIKECILNLKVKNSAGYARITKRILVDRVDIITEPLSDLMNMIYMQKVVPDQQHVAKNIPVFKNEGANKDIENYMPIANLCSSSKIFENLILKCIHDIQ
jgi:hypothetical protein